MKQAVIFCGQDSLNFMNIRNNIIRIPEVYQQIQKAQKVSDEQGTNSYFAGIDFSLAFLQDDEAFKNNLKLKNVLHVIVQLGLYDRYTKKNGRPDYIVGDISGESTVNIISAEKTFQSLFMINETPGELKVISSEPILSGSTMGLNQIFDLQSDEDKKIHETKQNMELLLQYLIEDKGVKRFVNIGPGLPSNKLCEYQLEQYDINMFESIDVDPMLSWFWPAIKKAS